MNKQHIFILSPQHWGTMFLSKHHYAIELTKMGNEVFFINPPEPTWKFGKSHFDVKETEFQGLFLVDQKLNVPYNLKFHLKPMFHFFMKRHIANMENILGAPDLVWSFDLGNNYPFIFFSNSAKKLFFPADFPRNKMAIEAAKGADLIVSIAQEILDEYTLGKSMKLIINHGVAQHFIDAGAKPYQKKEDIIRVGLSGSFIRPDIDRPILLEIIKSHPSIIFEFYGAIEMKDSNIGGGNDTETLNFIKTLKSSDNVLLHGAIPSHQLSKELRRMDLFLICYDVQKDQSKGTNYHKVMEYLAYGKPIISNNISSYSKSDNLIKMCQSRQSNLELKKLFHEVISNLNNIKNESQIIFSKANSYTNQTSKILKTINSKN
jgi:glycosyltransferase involved in cell wall biosynthesis